MALNLATFRTRTLTAIVFVIIMLAGLLLNQGAFFLLFSVIHFGCWFEYQKLVTLIDIEYAQVSLFHKFGVMILGWCIMLYFTNGATGVFDPLMHDIGQWLGLALLVGLLIEVFISKSKSLRYVWHSIFGLIYISLSLGLFVNLHSLVQVLEEPPDIGNWHTYRWGLAAFVIGCMWINDTMAYIVGSFIGKTPLSRISPKKTWEGTIGGIVLCAVVAGHLGYKFLHDYFGFGLASWTILAGIAAIAGTFGDLLESKLKRLAMVKDSGHIMPGHGGFLDRFDSILIAGPVVWICVKLIYQFTL